MRRDATCAAIGEGNLILCCLKDLVDHDIQIKVVFTNTEFAQKFCEDNNIPWYKRNADLAEILKETDIDYLFSISNPRILKEEVLKIPRKLTINYHDSPLPAYAGVHSTSWAIMRGEKRHGISWHVVEVGIDTGDILQSEVVDIREDDSALTVNLKCVESAKQAFKRLLDDIVNNTLKRMKQPLEGRTYFGLYAVPENVGVLTFNKEVSDIYNLARGLELGNHDNALGSPKVRTSNGNILLVTTASLLDEGYNLKCDARPGIILDIVDDTLIVATKTEPIQLSLAHLDGSILCDTLFEEFGLYKGQQLNNEFNVNVNEIAPFRKKEAFWRRRMVEYEPTMFYRQKMNVVANIIDVSTEMTVKSITLNIPNNELNDQADNNFVQACFVAFLARITCSTTVSIGILADKEGLPNQCKDLYSDIIPATFTVDNNDEITDVFEKCANLIRTHVDARTFLVDMFYRYPELRGHKRIPHHNIVIGKDTSLTKDDANMNSILHESNVLLLFSSEEQEIKILYHERPAQDFSHVIDVLRHFTTFMNAVNECSNGEKLKNMCMVPQNELNLFYSKPPAENVNSKEGESISKLVKMQCSLTPLRVALKTTKHLLTYNKLLDEVNGLSKLLGNAIQPTLSGTKEIIALHMPNSIAYVVSLLAVTDRKMAFLPLPVDCPADRLVFTLKDARATKMILTKDKFDKCDLNGLTAYMRTVFKHRIADEELVLIDFDKAYGNADRVIDLNGNENGKTKPCVGSDVDFSYVMYTSGSTGRPKGVKVKETGVINLARAQIACWDIESGDVIAQFASIGFDAAVSEIFTTLLSGATLAILGATERLGSDFLTAMSKMKVSVITLPPSALNIYSPDDLPTLRKVVSAGEACTLNTAVKWTSADDVRFFNAYGPTEGTVCATCHEYYPGTKYEDVNRDLPIGKAIDGVHVYLFDELMSPVPPDVVGEIYIGGKGLAHGYIGHASHFTDERFVQNPLTKTKSLLYKTGDHGFQDNDGNITYIGRMDDQVKIRGHRIDLSEIEQVLIQHPKIEMAFVVVHKCSSKHDMSIAAYVAPTFVYISELREYLSKVLPKYMIPTYIKKTEVADLPQTLNGKVNRKLLEMDEGVHEQLDIDGHSHLNETQLLVARFWCQLFKFDESAIYSMHRQSSFSELGGNSLQLVLLLRLIEDELGIDFSFTDLGTADTIEEFSEVIRRSKDIKRKCLHSDTKTKEHLRELIFHDSELNSSFVPNQHRRRSIQVTSFNTMIHKFKTMQHPKNILISGVTGFLGAFLLSEIMEQSSSHVCCMVREKTETRGIGRIIDNMRRYGLWKYEYFPRIAVVVSDLSQKNMGIAPHIYRSLCNAVDVVFMNAAMMNFNTPYEDHKVANVESTKEFIKFAQTGVQKFLFATSSLSVFLFPERGNARRVCDESEFFDDPLLIEGGYGQSKWASERLVMQALDFLPGGAIFRPARVTGRSSDGAGPTNDIFASTLKGMKRLGCYPDMDFPYDLTPVDFCAKAMIEITTRICNTESSSHQKVFHLFNRDCIKFKELFDGMDLKPLPLNEWRKVLKCADEDQKELIPYTPFFMSDFWDRAPDWPVFNTTNTDKETSAETKELMKPSSELLKTYKTYFGLRGTAICMHACAH